ncbi:hypothetical protein G7Y89_g14592 [Cudoniella acicularis]|uniref:Uncharacterized protein n=1 Tax=Cudoniella acicularis TaxID=354080 RepID=A0A8H4QZT7_9HELO|nr:hypothetical protein G7Y89_g14592 [Cudoniella acicularis]
MVSWGLRGFYSIQVDVDFSHRPVSALRRPRGTTSWRSLVDLTSLTITLALARKVSRLTIDIDLLSTFVLNKGVIQPSQHINHLPNPLFTMIFTC